MTQIPHATPAPVPAARQAAAAPGPGDWGRIGLLTLFWGSAFALMDVALETLSPVMVVSLRMWIGAVFLFLIAAVLGARMPRILPRPDPAWFWIAAVALVGNTTPFFLIAWAQQVVDTGVTGIAVATAPLWVALIAHFLVAGERMTGRRALGLGVASIGVAALFAPTINSGGQGGVDGYALAVGGLLLAAFLYGCTAVLARFSTHDSMIGGAAGVCLFAALVCTPFGLWDFAAHGVAFSPRSAAAVAALGVGPTALATILYLSIARRSGPGFLSMTNYLVPPFAVALGALALGERLHWSGLVALALILLGVLLAGRRARPKPD